MESDLEKLQENVYLDYSKTDSTGRCPAIVDCDGKVYSENIHDILQEVIDKNYKRLIDKDDIKADMDNLQESLDEFSAMDLSEYM